VLQVLRPQVYAVIGRGAKAALGTAAPGTDRPRNRSPYATLEPNGPLTEARWER